MLGLSRKIGSYVLDLLYPVSCLGCGQNREDLPAEKRWICPDCMEKITVREEQACPGCEKVAGGGATHHHCRTKISLDGLWVATSYEGVVEQAVHQLKFHFVRDASFPLAELMIQSVEAAKDFGDFQDLLLLSSAKEDEEGIYEDENRNHRSGTVLMPVPLSRRRYAARGFNQSALLAQRLARHYGLAFREDLLVRKRHTRQQSWIANQKERRRNVEGAFLVPASIKVQGANIILVDDVCTTGATLDECAKELKRSGARKVWGFVAARR